MNNPFVHRSSRNAQPGETVADILRRYRDDSNDEADRLTACADACAADPQWSAVYRRAAERARLMAWDAHGELVKLNTDREAA